MNGELQLVWPAAQYLPGYVHALQRGWSPDNLRPQAALEELVKIAKDPDEFLSLQVDREAAGPRVMLPDGSAVLRLPGYAMWMWDGEFCGSVGFRWKPGTTELPPHCLGHVGYSVVPWKRRRGYATRALQLLLPRVAKEGLPHVDLTTDASNVASQRVIEANGGTMVERFHKSAAHGGAESLRFRIVLGDQATEDATGTTKATNRGFNMVKGLGTVIYHVTDLDRAKVWYAKAFQQQPYFDQPFYVGFNIAGYELGLDPNQNVSRAGRGGGVAYWRVAEIESAVQYFVAAGAKEVTPIQDVGEGIKVATVADPFDNVIGLIENPHFELPKAQVPE